MTLCRNCVRGVYDYAETVSAETMTTLKLFPPSLWLCWNCVGGVYDSAETVSAKSMTMLNCVRRVYDYAESGSAESMTTLKLCSVHGDYDPESMTLQKLSAESMTLQKLWPQSRWLRWNCVCRVYDYAKLCLRSLWLRWSCVCRVYDFAKLSPQSRWLRGNCVRWVYYIIVTEKMHTKKVLKDFAKNEIKIIAKFKRSVAEIFYFIFAKFKTFL